MTDGAGGGVGTPRANLQCLSGLLDLIHGENESVPADRRAHGLYVHIGGRKEVQHVGESPRMACDVDIQDLLLLEGHGKRTKDPSGLLRFIGDRTNQSLPSAAHACGNLDVGSGVRERGRDLREAARLVLHG